ncbi:MAG: hypothetical protein O2897_02265, partial [bacterium]|nr:hypothetical protein [bacterium]
MIKYAYLIFFVFTSDSFAEQIFEFATFDSSSECRVDVMQCELDHEVGTEADINGGCLVFVKSSLTEDKINLAKELNRF